MNNTIIDLKETMKNIIIEMIRNDELEPIKFMSYGCAYNVLRGSKRSSTENDKLKSRFVEHLLIRRPDLFNDLEEYGAIIKLKKNYRLSLCMYSDEHCGCKSYICPLCHFNKAIGQISKEL